MSQTSLADHWQPRRSSYNRRRSVSTSQERKLSDSPASSAGLDKKFYLNKIVYFADKYPEGAEIVVDKLAELFNEDCMKEASLNNRYKELQGDKATKEDVLKELELELELLKDSVSEVQASPELTDDPNLGIVIFHKQAITANQANFFFETQRQLDSMANKIRSHEVFLTKSYLNMVEMVSRFARLILVSIDNWDINSFEDLRQLCKETGFYVTMFSNRKGLVFDSSQGSVTSVVTEQEGVVEEKSDPSEIYQAFMSVFGNHEMALQFSQKTNKDALICSFITLENVEDYLCKCQHVYGEKKGAEHAFEDIFELRNVATDNMVKKVETALNYFTEINKLVLLHVGECYQEFQAKNHNFKLLSPIYAKTDDHPPPAISNRKWSEHPAPPPTKSPHKVSFNQVTSSGDVNNTISLRRANTQTDLSKGIKKIETIQELAQPKKEVEDDFLAPEDLLGRLEDVTKSTLKKSGRRAGDGTAFMSKSQREEERLRLLNKAKKEKARQHFLSMNDEQYIDWKRKQLKNGKDDHHIVHEDPLAIQNRSNYVKQIASKTIYVAELRKMIQNSKILSKINIVERYKSECENFRTLKYDTLGHYIPPDPVVVSKVATPLLRNRSSLPLMSLNSPMTAGTPLTPVYNRVPMTSRNSTRNGPLPFNAGSVTTRGRPSSQSVSTSRFFRFKNSSQSPGVEDSNYPKEDITVIRPSTTRNENILLKSPIPQINKRMQLKSRSQQINREDVPALEIPEISERPELNNLPLHQGQRKPKKVKQTSGLKEVLKPLPYAAKTARPRNNNRTPPKKNLSERSVSTEMKFKVKQVKTMKRGSSQETGFDAVDSSELLSRLNIQLDPVLRGVYVSPLVAASSRNSPRTLDLL